MSFLKALRAKSRPQASIDLVVPLADVGYSPAEIREMLGSQFHPDAISNAIHRARAKGMIEPIRPRPGTRPITSYVSRRGVTLPFVSILREPAAPAPPVDARTLERDRMADEMLHDAMRLARLIPRYEPPRAWIVKAERQVRQ